MISTSADFAAVADPEISNSLQFAEAAQLLEKRKWEEAAIALRSVLKRDPAHSAAAMGLATALAHLGRREEALGVLSQTLSQIKGNAKTLLIRRIRVISRTFMTNTNYQAYQDALNLISAKKYPAAAEKLTKLLEQEPNNLDVLVRLGQSLILDGDYDSAAERLRLAKRLNPHEPVARLWLGRALFYRGELNEAIAELKSAKESLSASELVPLWLSEAQYSVGQRNVALALLQEDIKARPMHVSALVSLARLRILMPGTDSQPTLQAAKKDLQLALSRVDEYASIETMSPEGELALDTRPSTEQLKAEIQRLFQEAEAKLARLSEPKAPFTAPEAR